MEVKEKSYEIIEISEEGEEDDDKQETVEKNNKLKPLGKEENEKLYDKKIIYDFEEGNIREKSKNIPVRQDKNYENKNQKDEIFGEKKDKKNIDKIFKINNKVVMKEHLLGLVNEDLRCFFNSVIQSLFDINSFKNLIMSDKIKDPKFLD